MLKNGTYATITDSPNILTFDVNTTALGDVFATKIYVDDQDTYYSNQKQNTLIYVQPSGGYQIGSGLIIKGIKAGTYTSISDTSNVLTVDIDVNSLSSAFVNKSFSGTTTYLNINSSFRIAFDSTNDQIDFQYYDNDGFIQSNSWMSIGKFIWNTTLNIGSMKVTNIVSDDASNNIYVNSNILVDNIKPNQSQTVTVTGNLGVSNSISSDVIIANSAAQVSINDNLNVSGALAVDTIKKNANTTVLCDDSLTVAGQLQINNRLNNPTAGQGQIYLNGGNGNRIDFNNNGVSPPTLTNRSAGTKLLLYLSLSSTTADFAMGIANDALWSSVGASVDSFKWYAGGNNIATLTGNGNLTVTGNLTTNGNVSITGDLTVNGNSVFSMSNPYWVAAIIDYSGGSLYLKAS